MVKEIYQDGKGDLKEITKNSLKNLNLMNFQLRINTLLNFWRRNIMEKRRGKRVIQIKESSLRFHPLPKEGKNGKGYP
jgi:hypothetical protein